MPLTPAAVPPEVADARAALGRRLYFRQASSQLSNLLREVEPETALLSSNAAIVRWGLSCSVMSSVDTGGFSLVSAACTVCKALVGEGEFHSFFVRRDRLLFLDAG
jgi:hypothetical protein